MMDNPLLLVGGSGVVGERTAQQLRTRYPEVPLLIGGRDAAKADAVAKRLGNAEGIAIDLAAPDLGTGTRAIGAVAIFLKDDRLSSLRFAQSRGIPHVSISTGTFEIGPEVSAHIHQPGAAPVVMGSEWLAGAAMLPTLAFAQDFERISRIRIGALLDEDDIGGPAAEIDMHRLTEFAPAALTRRDGTFYWRVGDDAASRLRAVDGTEMEAFAYSPFDIAALAAVTGAPDIAFDIAVGLSSSRRDGQPMSTEIIIDLEGFASGARPLRTTHAIVHPEGQAPLTALGVAMMLERLTGLDGARPTPPGLYFPEQLIDPDGYLSRLQTIGGTVTVLESGR